MIKTYRQATFFILVLLLLCALVTTGCGGGATKNASAKSQEGASYIVVDDTGRQITMPHKPQHIVSTTYGTDEILVELVDLKRIKSFCKYAGDPEITFITKLQADKVGHKVAENLEAIVALEPDLVVVSVSTNASMVKTLEDMKIPVYIAASPKTYEAMKSKINHLALAVGEAERGLAVTEAMDTKLAAIHHKLRPITKDKERIVMAFSYIGAIGRKGNLLDDIFIKARVRNGAAEAGLVQGADSLSKEKIIAINPEVFLLPTWNVEGKNDYKKYAEQLRSDPAYAKVRAIENNRLVGVSDKYRYVASQHVADSVEAVAKAVYPEWFK